MAHRARDGPRRAVEAAGHRGCRCGLRHRARRQAAGRRPRELQRQPFRGTYVPSGDARAGGRRRRAGRRRFDRHRGHRPVPLHARRAQTSSTAGRQPGATACSPPVGPEGGVARGAGHRLLGPIVTSRGGPDGGRPPCVRSRRPCRRKARLPRPCGRPAGSPGSSCRPPPGMPQPWPCTDAPLSSGRSNGGPGPAWWRWPTTSTVNGPPRGVGVRRPGRRQAVEICRSSTPDLGRRFVALDGSPPESPSARSLTTVLVRPMDRKTHPSARVTWRAFAVLPRLPNRVLARGRAHRSLRPDPWAAG